MALEERRARAYALASKYAHTHTSVDAFLAGKREEVELEEERYRRRHGGTEARSEGPSGSARWG